MKIIRLFFMTIFFSLMVICQLRGEDRIYFPETGRYIPDYSIESLHENDSRDDLLLPFVYNGYLYTFSMNQKLPLWRIFIGGDLTTPFLLDDKNLYIYDIYNRIYAIDVERRKIRWRIEIQNEIKGRLLTYKNFIIVSVQNGTIYIINSESGNVVYEYRGDGEINTALNMYKNLMIVPYKNGKIVAYDIETRMQEWVFYSGGIISVPPVIKDNYLFFGAWDDNFYVIDVFSGKPSWVSYVGEPISRDFLIFDTEIILFFAKGEILCLDKYNGEIQWVKYFSDVEFNYNYFPGLDKFFVFIPDFIAIDLYDGNISFHYRERAFYFYKEMLFENMIEGTHRLSEKDRIRLLSEIYFTVSNYPQLPPVVLGTKLSYFVADNAHFYVYDLVKDFFVVKYKLG
jgi:outer membrane protein assembly factor BamB